MNYETVTETITRFKDPRGAFIDLASRALKDRGYAIKVGYPINQDAVVVSAEKEGFDTALTASGREIRMNASPEQMAGLVEHRLKAAEDIWENSKATFG